MIAPAAFLAKIKHVALRTPGKKILKGGGEKGTSKTCTFCYTWNQDLVGKTLNCKRCHRKIDREVNAALNNLKELLNELFNSDGTPRVQQQQQQQQQQQGGGGEEEGEEEVEEGEGEGEEEDVEELDRAFAR